MPRIIISEPFPRPPVAFEPDVTVIAPHSGVRRVLRVPTRSLQDHAKEILKRNGFGIATPIKAASALRQAVNSVLPNADASAVARLHREMIGAILRSGIDLDKLASVGSPRSRAAAEIAAIYVEILRRERLVDSDAVLSTTLSLDLVRPMTVLIYGYFRARRLPARPEEIEFIDTLSGDESVLYLPCTDAPLFSANRAWLDLLRSRGWKVTKDDHKDDEDMGAEIRELARTFARGTTIEPNGEKTNTIEAIEYPDLESEVRGTLARAKAAILEGVPVSDVAIVCRDVELYAASIISTAREYSLPVEIDLEIPIARTAIGEFVSLLFEVLEIRSDEEIAARIRRDRRGFQYEPTLRLLLHRLGPGLSDEARAEAYRTRPSGFERWCAISDEVGRLAPPSALDGLAWALWLRTIFIDWRLRGEDKLGGSASDIEAYDRFFDALDEHCLDRGSASATVSSFAGDVTDVLAHIKTPLHAERGGVKVLLPNEVVGREFRRVFVMGMAEGILPKPSIDNNVIDFYERNRLRSHEIHFEDALEVPRWEALTFYFTILAFKEKIGFSYPRFASDAEQIESSYFGRMGLKPMRSRERFVSSIPEYRRAYLLNGEQPDDDKVFLAAQRQYAVEARRESSAPHDEYDGVTGIGIRPRRWSASSLSRFGSCPFKWFAHDVLRLNEPDEAESDLRADKRGRLLHKTLELAAKRAQGAADLRSAMLEVLEEEFAAAEALDDSISIVANWSLRRTEQIEKLRIAISSEHFVKDGAMVVDAERKFEAELGGITITGIIDRIDRLPGGEFLAVDYKSGNYIAKIKDDSGYLKIDIQMPIYSQVAASHLYPNETCIGGQFIHLSEPRVTRGRPVDLERILARIKALVDRGQFAVDPDVKFDACKFCEYDVVCRTGPRLARKRAQN